MPALRALTRALGREVMKNCGETPNMIPVLEYEKANTDIYYSAWYWNSYPGSGYYPLGVSFGISPNATEGSSPLYECLILQQQYENHWLTFSSTCDGIPNRQVQQLGYAWKTQTANTVAIWRYDQIASPWPHRYLAMDTTLPGFVKEEIVFYAYPPSSV